MKIIFLDIDGVMNYQDAYTKKECFDKPLDIHYENGDYKYPIHKDKYQTFGKDAKDLINKLILETGANVVISSSWRHSGIDYMRDVWSSEKMEGEIIGITPVMLKVTGIGLSESSYRIPRGCEIEYYIENSKIQIDEYVIIDDDMDMLYSQKNNFIHIIELDFDGFAERHYNKALKILNGKYGK